MKLTKKLETEILKVYNTYWNAVLKGDIASKAACMDDNIQIIGSAEDEVFLNKKDAIKFYNATSGQVAGKVELRNRKIKTKPFDDLILISEISDLYILIDDEWVFYSKFRSTSFLKGEKNSWKFVYLHASIPDSKTEKGEQLALKKIKKENLELRQAVKRRTIELEQKNRELEIEAALEHVRSLALSMHKSGEVGNVTDKLFEELNKLTLKLLGCTIIVIDEKRDTWETWRARTKVVVKPFEVASFKRSMRVLKKHMPKWFPVFFEALNARDKYLIEEMPKKRRTQLLNSIAQQYNYTEKEKTKLLKITPEKITAHFLFFKLGYLALITEKRLPEENLVVARRFVEVFDFAYTRFLDIKNAEEQAREAQFQLALERVRARTMAMQESNELAETAALFFKQFNELALLPDKARTYFSLFDTVKDTAIVWMTQADGSVRPGSHSVPLKDSSQVAKVYEGWKQKEPVIIRDMTGRKLGEYLNFLSTLPHVKKDKALQRLISSPPQRIVFTEATFKHGTIGIMSGEPVTQEAQNSLIRFSKVFEQTYTRFLDLQKAEEQTREAQIQASLERVRASAMAMHKSEELLDVCETMFKEFLTLGFDEMRNAIINIHNDTDNSFINYDYAEAAGKSVNRFTNDVLPFVSKMMKISHSSNDAFSETHISGKTLTKFRDLRKQTGQKDEPRLNKAKSLYFYFYSIGIGAIGISTYGPIKNEKKALLKRFRDVFNLSYKRYIDISRAEAQAREAEIQLALERVRARTMAMHHSNEIDSVGSVLFHQLLQLNIPALRRCLIGIVDEANGTLQSWFTSMKGDSSHKIIIYPLSGQPVIESKIKAWREQKQISIELSGKKLEDFIKYTVNHGFELQKGEAAATYMIQNHAPFKYGYLEVATHEPISDNDFELLQRFASVFEQTYTRFLDLQKAETQARESEIQLALERVRARTMAMQHSDELKEAASLLFQQVQKLGVKPWSCGFNIWEKDKSAVTAWLSPPQGGVQPPLRMPVKDIPLLSGTMKAFEKGEALYVEEVSGKKLEEQWAYLATIPGFLDMVDKSENAGLSLPTFEVHHTAFFSYGFLLFVTLESCPEAHDIFKRFAQVFEQTYTRFLDLQKAEAQAREAKIEAALEKVRSRSLAMHKSDELQDVVNTVFERLKTLEIDLNVASIFIFKEGSKDWEQWVASSDTNYSTHFHIPYTDNIIFRDLEDAKQSGRDFYSVRYSLEEKNKWFSYAFTNTEYSRIPDNRKKFLLESEFYQVSFALSKHIGLQLAKYSGDDFSDKDNEILKRFSRVFEQAYVRFLDLQKAEAQARESEIQLALERVRARTMAMHKSEELSETVAVLFQQFKELGSTPERMNICHFNEESDLVEVWSTEQGGKQINHSFNASLKEPTTVAKTYDGWKQGKKSMIVDLTGKELSDWIRYLKKEIKLPFREELRHNRRVHTIAFFSNGMLLISTPEPVPEKTINLLEQFASVFNLTYRRFLDLQKAEAQARESEIQLALERVRARTMAMQHSNELSETASIFFKQMSGLGIETNRLYIGIFNDDSGIMEAWATTEEGSTVSSEFFLDSKKNYSVKKMYEGWKEQKKSISIDMQGNELLDYIRYISEEVHVPVTTGYSQHRRVQDIAYFSKGLIGLASPEPQPDENIDLLERFAKVFDQTYTRFLDLQKAEALAREAQIEVALERVRSRTMGMQKSEELKEVIQLVYEQFVHLNIHIEHTGFILDYKARDDLHIWLADQREIPSEITIPCFDSPPNNSIRDAKEKGQDFFKYLLSFEEKNKFYRDLFKFIPGVPEESLEYYFNCPGLAGSGVLLENIGLYIENFSGTPYTDEENKILMRFGKVFQQTYTRFLDLQKAEVQAREAKIEAALERVRSRTMGMQHSSELQDASDLLFQQVLDLGVPAFSCGYNIWEKGEKECTAWMSDPSGGGINPAFRIPLTEDPNFIRFRESKQKKEEFYVLEMRGERMQEHYQYLRKTIPVFDEAFKKVEAAGLTLPETQIHHLVNFDHGNVMFITLEPCLEAHDIFKRFGKVFEQTYTRFLDLKKAEEQAREAQIEAALEKVRSRSLAMHSTNELGDVVTVIVEKLKDLGVVLDANGVVLCTYFPDSKDVLHWIVSPDFSFTGSYLLPYFDHPIFNDAWQSKESGVEYFSKAFTIEEKNSFFEYAFEHSDYKLFPDEFKQWVFQNDKHILSFAWQKNSAILIPSHTGVVPSEVDVEILKRFAKVFEQSYVRFLDLKKAEAQTRETQIEMSLERVRAKAMAMRSSSDIPGAVAIVFKELSRLGIEMERNGILLFSEETPVMEVWSTPLSVQEHEEVEIIAGLLDSRIHPLLQGVYDAWKSGEKYFCYELIGEEVPKYYELLKKQQDYRFPTIEKYPDFQVGYGFLFQEGQIFAFTKEHLSEEEKELFYRFTNVFSLTYRRYLDIVKAEKQAREAQIEAALERVRAKSLAMHQTSELQGVVDALSQQMNNLNIDINGGVFIIINKEVDNDIPIWGSAGAANYVQKVILPFHDIKTITDLRDAIKNKKDFLIEEFTKEEKIELFEYLFIHPPWNLLPPKRKKELLSREGGYTRSLAVSRLTSIMMINHYGKKFSNSENEILKRFGKVFEQSYVRFLDLQKAEAQARDAQIEAALEKVRARAMAMHSSEDLSASINVFFKELKLLGVVPRRCGVAIINESTHRAYNMITTATSQGDSFELTGEVNLDSHPLLTNVLNYWKEQKEYFPKLNPSEMIEYYRILKPQVAVTDFNDEVQYAYYLPFKEGSFYLWTDKELKEEELRICRRFTSVIGLTYRRYLDLKEAEARAFEAVRQASLDRVRAEIASMRTTEDLNRITPIIWRELKALEVPFIRCGVFIVDEEQSTTRVYLTTPDGKSLGVLNLSFDANDLTSNTVEHWQKKKTYREHWDRQGFINWTKSMMKLGQVQNRETYQGSSQPPESLHLHFVPFAQGMLYVGDVSPLTDEKLDLVKTLAEAFSIAYARYEDFNNLEEAKNKIEITLNELRSAQAQLIHAEKLASLGELTAGIAHEIKNPLNFVNNFSELSKELLDEIKTELENNNKEEILAILEDMKLNLEKINEHGKRADSIVKGMLLHSRGTSGDKTLTDINDLLDQYVNLAYHGMRAQNKEFNITIEKDFDETLEKINVVPQDISRVFLNIINNACYAAYERKKKSSDSNFSPTLKVTTKKLNDNMEIRISDNGNGIPDDILDKIFQPFFTTKPTGKGTGLGLSLSYDIVVKQHSGKIKIESKEGEGAEFIIHLPV